MPSTLHTYTYAKNNPVNLVDPSGQNPFVIAAVLGGLIGGIGGAIFHALSNPFQSLGDMLTSGDFWRDVGVGALSGALAGLVGFFAPQLLVAAGLNIQAGIAAAVFDGALTGVVVSGTVTNLLTGQPWHTWLVGAVLTGAVLGGIAGGLGYGVGKVLQGLKSQKLLPPPGEFGNSGSIILTEDNYLKYGRLWGRGGQAFVTSTEAADALVYAPNRAEIGRRLGKVFSEGSPLMRVDIDDLAAFNVRMPTSGNKNWVPGGWASGGLPERVIDSLDLTQFKSVIFWLK